MKHRRQDHTGNMVGKPARRGGQTVVRGHLLARAVPALGSNADSVKVPLKISKLCPSVKGLT